MKKVRIGFIGVGGMAEGHLKTLRKVEAAEITAVFDINEARARQIAKEYDATAYESSEKLMDSGQVDAIFICTPPFARDSIEEAAAKRGIHLLAEKPIGLSLEEARRKEKIIRDSGIIHSSGYCLRYLDTVQKAKQYLAGKQIDMILAYRLGGMPGVPWWRVMERSGGQLVEMATHQVDLIRYMAGDFRDVQAIYARRHIHRVHPEATVPDVGVVSFTLQSGAVGTISNTCLSRHLGRGEVELFGHDFYVSVNGKSLRIVDDEQRLEETTDVDFVFEQDRAFVEAVRTGRRELVLGDYSEAVATLAATLAANESAAERGMEAAPLIAAADEPLNP
ncbi:Gfo/Idh/MocA family protein [Paenibacillus sp. J2TS4]|uniref:Gfo/Idh/MocA family protein n=1 Tax=Paenibacillus sp. J2TS4 TaxID=2807194 RepID=UPI001B04F956|nr:Gfo/Idh/MocA family oxidoreductase [Paenibacillus sp. J2TS4]GIP35181.1 hypothetical protein J2TS4_43910 [Paenibacillus sp. J2TS4]